MTIDQARSRAPRFTGTRIGIGVVLLLVPVATVVVTGIVLLPRLGPVIASHWSGRANTPDGFTDTTAYFWTFATIATTLALVGVVIVVLARGERGGRIGAAVMALIAGMTALALLLPALSTAEASDPERARLGWWMVLLLAPVLLAALAYLVVPGDGRVPSPPRTVEPVPLGNGERIAWSGRTGSRLFSILGVLVIALGVGTGVAVIATDESGPALIAPIVVLVAGASVFLLARVRLTIDERGVRLLAGVVHVPLINVPLSNLASVTVDTIEPMHWGGWGLRFGAGRIAYVTRRGPGIVITRRDGRTAAITIPGADAAAAVAEALIRR